MASARGGLPRSFLVATQSASHEVRFGEYTLDFRAGELRRNGAVLKLQPQPARVLAILVSRAREVVTREELVQQVWGPGTYVDFEHGLNYAIRQIRGVLDDDPEHPQFIETIPKRGYRFIAPLSDHTASEQAPAGPDPVQRGSSANAARRSAGAYLVTGVLVVVIVVAVGWTYLHGPPTGSARIESVAVLPLRNLSNDPEQEYFTDGITDELITELAKSGSLRVISHTSVERYKGARPPLPEIATQLGVDAIVEGTVMRSAGRVRITAQLIDAHSDRHLWADSYERDMGDIVSLQDEVARRIASAIGTRLIVGQQLRPASRPTLDPAAHEAYLRGSFYWNQLSCDGFHKAQPYFEQAVKRDPRYSLAYVGLAKTYFTLADWGCSSDPELIAKSKLAVLKSLELDPSSGEAHAWLGKLALFYEWDFHKTANELAQAVELSPNYPEAHIIYAVFLVTTGSRELGLAEMRKAHDIDPISQLTNVITVVVFYLAHQYDAAIEQGKRTIELYPGSSGAYIWLAFAYEKRGLYDQAIASYLNAKTLDGVSPEGISAFRTAYQKAGMRGFWQEELEYAKKNLMTSACQFTSIHAHLGDEKQALDFLNQSSLQHCSGPHTTIADPVLDEFRQNPRFKEITDRLGL